MNGARAPSGDPPYPNPPGCPDRSREVLELSEEMIIVGTRTVRVTVLVGLSRRRLWVELRNRDLAGAEGRRAKNMNGNGDVK